MSKFKKLFTKNAAGLILMWIIAAIGILALIVFDTRVFGYVDWFNPIVVGLAAVFFTILIIGVEYFKSRKDGW
jgi:hypothetical protein